MIFCYRCGTCDTLDERVFRAGKAPPAVPCPCGGRAERDYAAEGVQPADAQIRYSKKYPYTSRRLPLHLEGAPHDKQGRTIVTSARHEADLMARHNLRRD